MADIQVYEVVHSSPEFKTLGDYIGRPDSPAQKYTDKEDDFLQVKGERGTNEEMINLLLTKLEQQDNKQKSGKQKLIKPGTVFYIPVTKVEVAGLLTQGIEVVSTNIPAFKSKQLLEIENDKGYEKSYTPQLESVLDGKVIAQIPKVSVWVWCRSLSRTWDLSGQTNKQLEGEIFDISPFIQKLTTTVSKNGGNFQITLPPITCEIEDTVDQNNKVNRRWVLKKDDIKIYSEDLSDNDISYLQQSSFFLESFTDDETNQSTLLRNQYLFHNIIGSNDLVFIRFETLKMEVSQRYEDKSELYVNKDKLAGRIYDMIGLVDYNNLASSFQNYDVSISITGRDLIKPLIDDGVYFYNLENITGQFRIAGEATRESELLRRVVGDNTLYYLNLYQNQSIENVLKFIIQQLSTISIVPDNLFESYGIYGGKDRRNRRQTPKSQLQQTQNLNQTIEEKKVKIYALIKLAQLEEGGIIEVIYQKLHTFLVELRDKKKRINGGNKTVGWQKFTYETGGVKETLETNEVPQFFFNFNLVCEDKFYSTVRHSFQPLNDVIDKIDEVIDLEQSQNKSKDENRFDETLAKGIWQIIKLIVDRNVTDRRIVDSSMSSANGSLLNFIRKVCQEPFVEFYSDTYGDLFYLIARKPPTDSVGIRSLLNGNIEDENGTSKLRSPVISIFGEEVHKEDLSMDDREVYSWYSFKPQNVVMSGGNVLPAAYTPAIFFEEYAKIWGSRPLDLVHNYNPYIGSYDEDKGVPDVSRYEEQAILDLKFIIDSHSYLPFTRRGSITINGDRRLKKGNLVRYAPTQEIFMIDSVTHNYSTSDSSVDRTTTISVSRGMIEPFIYGVELEGFSKPISYFNIINTNFDIKKKQYNEESEEQVPVKVKKSTTTNDSNKVVVQGETVQVSPGFNEYIQHQQGAYGAKLIINAAKNDSSVPPTIQQNMSTNVGRDFTSSLTPRNFLKYQIQLYNKKYQETQATKSNLDTLYLTAAKSVGIQLDTLRTFGYIESSHGKNLGSGTYYGVMQLSAEVAKKYDVNRYDNYQNILGGAKLLKDNSRNQLISTTFVFPPVTSDEYKRNTEETEETIYETRKVKKQYIGIDIDSIFSNLKVNQDIFNFFLRNEQFSKLSRTRTNEQAAEQDKKA